MHAKDQQQIKQQHKKQTGKCKFGCADMPEHFLCPWTCTSVCRYPQCVWLTVLPSIFRWFFPFWAWCQLEREDFPSNLLTLVMSYMTIFITYLNACHTSVLDSWGYRGRLKPSQQQFFLQENLQPLKQCLRSRLSLSVFVTVGTYATVRWW